jgi:hypothetical protein
MRKNEMDRMTSELPASATKICLAGHDPMTVTLGSACPWPFRAEDSTPLAWWRTLESHTFGDAERLLLEATLEQIEVLHGGGDFAAALKGGPAAAIGVVLSLMPIEEMTLKVDIAMTSLLRCVLERNAASALVLAQVLGLTDLGHSYARELAVSWLAHGRRCSNNPRKFSEAETVLESITVVEIMHEVADLFRSPC